MNSATQLTQQIQAQEWHTLLQTRVLATGDTGKQAYRIVELAYYGKAMIINDCIQSTQNDEADYHEALIFPAAMLHGNIKRVICFGGANGAKT